MMDVSRRGFFQRASGATVISICAIAAPVVLGQRPQKVSQDELTEPTVNHRAWLGDQGKGTRAVINNRDLSGLNFSYSHFCGNGFSQISFHGANLSSAKFNFANLSHVNFSSAICTQTDFSNSEVGYRARLAKAYFLAEQTIS